MPLVDRIIGRHNALEIHLVDGGQVARRYLVFACLEHGRDVVSAEMSEAPVEERRLPHSARDASVWLHEYFEDLRPPEFRAAVARLTRLIAVDGDLA